jgi:anti-sigma regulatory factor (Ser/Thr protein kinase)
MALGKEPAMNLRTEPVDADWELSSDESASALARQAVRSALMPVLSRRRLEDVVIATSELVSNAVRHSGARESGTVAVHVVADRGSLQVDVTDPGPGFDPSRLDDPASLAASGYGLRIVERLADRWGVASSSPTRVWFALDL